jgi:hypothetical protein
VCFLSGTLNVSPAIPVATAIGASVVLLIMWCKKRAKISARNLYTIDWVRNIFSVVFLFILFGYFARIPTDTLWPPVGDAIWHSLLTSLTIHTGHIPTDLMPLDSFRFFYPSGYHVFSADLSLLLSVNAAEAVFLLATYLTTVISGLLFTITYVLTKSLWMSLPIPFSILIFHSSNRLETWISGYLFNGPYPNLFGFMAVITAIVLLQMAYNNRQSVSKIMPPLIIILLALFITYPNFLLLSVTVIFVYLIIDILWSRAVKVHPTIANKSREIAIKSEEFSFSKFRGLHSINVSIIFSDRYSSIIISSLIIAIFIIVSFLTGLISFYHNLFTFYQGEFQKYPVNILEGTTSALSTFKSDIFYNLLILLAIVLSFAVIILKSKIVPFFVALLLFLIAVEVELSFIYPIRTLALVATLSWPLIAYATTELRPSNNRFAKYIVIGGFVAIAFYFEMPYIYLQATQDPGWFLTKTADFKDSYGLAMWLKTNAKPNDLILNDKSYSSLYIHGFCLCNLTYNYWNGHIKPEAEGIMQKNLNVIWTNPDVGWMIHSLLKRYNVKYVVLTAENGYQDYQNWGGSGQYLPKIYSNQQYEEFFNSYEFLQLKYTNDLHSAVVYSVK